MPVFSGLAEAVGLHRMIYRICKSNSLSISLLTNIPVGERKKRPPSLPA